MHLCGKIGFGMGTLLNTGNANSHRPHSISKVLLLALAFVDLSDKSIQNQLVSKGFKGFPQFGFLAITKE